MCVVMVDGVWYSRATSADSEAPAVVAPLRMFLFLKSLSVSVVVSPREKRTHRRRPGLKETTKGSSGERAFSSLALFGSYPVFCIEDVSTRPRKREYQICTNTPKESSTKGRLLE